MEHHVAKYKIEAAFTHVQTLYCHASLGAKIKIERIGDIEHIDDSFTPAAINSFKLIGITKQKIGIADLMVYVTGESVGHLKGMAGCLGCVCDTEIGVSSVSGKLRAWKVWKDDYWARHNANYLKRNLVLFAEVRYFFATQRKTSFLLVNCGRFVASARFIIF